MANFLITKKYWIVLVSLFATGHCLLNLKCAEDNNKCSLVSKDEPALSSEVKAVSVKCINEECKSSIVLGDNNQMYMCEHLNKRFGECQHLLAKSSLKSKNFLADLLDDSSSSESSDEVLNVDSEEINKRQLPFETLNYGRKRQLPFETLNFGKRRYLPFETMLYGRKRSLPFETLNYGKKRAYIPIDGYIMG